MSELVDLAEGDLLHWGGKWHTVRSTRMKDNGKLVVFCTDGLLIPVDPAEIVDVS